MRHRPWLPALALALLAGVFNGCGSSEVAVTGTDTNVSALNEIGESYRMYQIAKQKPPTKVADFQSLENIGGNGLAAVKSGEIVVEWGATLPDTSEEPGKVSSPEVLAYGKTVPTEGGSVLMLDRTIKKMTADEFKAAPKPATAKK
ncbi:MAG: hypothetical protein U0794_14820 [Isosphaeraceae bacterium]